MTMQQTNPVRHPQHCRAAERIARTQNSAISAQQGENPPVKNPSFLCRAMRPEDIPACAAIEAAVPDGWSAGALAEELLQPTARLFVAETPTPTTQPPVRHMSSTQPSSLQPPDTQPSHTPALHSPPPQSIAALAVFQLVCEEASLYTVSTAPAFRRQGAARVLLQYAFAQLAAGGAQTVFLEVRAQNTAARALYAALGFEETGIRRGFYTKPADDAVLLRRVLGNL